MPHFIVEYSANLESDLSIPSFLQEIQERAMETGVFPLGGIRVRAAKRDNYIVADNDPENAFIHLVARIREGRDLETRKSAGTYIFEAMCAYLQPIYDKRPLGISFEIQEIFAPTSFKKNNIHQHIRNKASRVEK